MKREREREAERFVGKHKSAANCKLWKMQLMALRRFGESWKFKIYRNAVKDAAHTLGGILAAGTESLHWRGGAGSGFHSHRAASAALQRAGNPASSNVAMPHIRPIAYSIYFQQDGDKDYGMPSHNNIAMFEQCWKRGGGQSHINYLCKMYNSFWQH